MIVFCSSGLGNISMCEYAGPQLCRLFNVCSMQIRPDRQTLYWSATWPKEVEQLARRFLYSPYKVSPFFTSYIVSWTSWQAHNC